MIEDKYYSHSGESPLLGIVTSLGLGAILGGVLGFVYNFAIVTIPLVYINFFMTVGFGLVLGYGVKFFGRFSKIRNSVHSLVLAGITGLFGFYFQWIAYFVYLDTGSHSFEAYQDNFDLFYDIGLFIYLIIDLNKVGSWEMFGIVFTDFPLWIIWGLEAFIVIGIPLIISYKHPIIPFSESLNCWYRKHTLKNEFGRVSTTNQFEESLSSNPELTIDNLGYGESYRFSKIFVYFLKDESVQYLSIDNVFIEGRGKGKKMSTPAFHLMKIDNSVANGLMEKYEAKKDFLIDY